ncbi:hypothetical protein D3C87_1600030 [compost metagenome]
MGRPDAEANGQRSHRRPYRAHAAMSAAGVAQQANAGIGGNHADRRCQDDVGRLVCREQELNDRQGRAYGIIPMDDHPCRQCLTEPSPIPARRENVIKNWAMPEIVYSIARNRDRDRT